MLTGMRKQALSLGVFLALLPVFALAALPGEYRPEAAGAGKPELHINADGSMSAKSVRVEQIAGTTIYLSMRWGQFPMHFTMKTDAKTTVKKRYGGTASVSAVKIGDYLDIEGEFFVGSDFFGLNARTVKDWALQEESGSFTGTILEIAGSTFTLQTPTKNLITVVPSPSIDILKGSVAIPWDRLRKGDTVTLADGIFDHSKNTLTASHLTIFQSKEDFKPKNFQGTLKTMAGTAIPTSMVVTVSGTDYTVLLSESTKILQNNKKPAILGRFVIGDTIRFYGAVKESDKLLTDALVVPADAVRNTSL